MYLDRLGSRPPIASNSPNSPAAMAIGNGTELIVTESGKSEDLIASAIEVALPSETLSVMFPDQPFSNLSIINFYSYEYSFLCEKILLIIS